MEEPDEQFQEVLTWRIRSKVSLIAKRRRVTIRERNVLM
jgi:hypothetical protein